jgi:hypothetical protein
MVTYFVFLLPMIVGYSLMGSIAGWFVGKRRWGNVGAAGLAAFLGLSPVAAGYGAGMYMMHLFITHPAV